MAENLNESISPKHYCCTENVAYRPAMEILRHTQNNGFIMWDSLGFVPPFPGDLYRCLDSLSTSVHRQDHVEAKELGDEFGKPWEHIVVESTRAQCQS